MDGCRGHGLIRPGQALAALDAVAALPPMELPIDASLHRVLARPALAACDLPPFTQSAVDGYAVRHADLGAGSLLPLAGAVRASALEARPQLAPGTAQRIYTGGMLPEGADTVVRQEHVQAGAASIVITRAIERGADVRHQGEELRCGATLAPAGQRLTPGLLAALAMAGAQRVTVHAEPRITILVTGDEVVPSGTAPALGQIHDANGPLVRTWLAAQGYTQVRFAHVADNAGAVRAALRDAFARSDLVLTTGGVSVGDHDHVPRVAAELGARTLFWKVAQKPGKPLFAALAGEVPLLGLPGNPASVLVNLLAYARRALDRLEGLSDPGPHFLRGVLEHPIKADAERDQWVRVSVRCDDAGVTRLGRLPKQASHMLSNLAQAGGLAWVPASEQATPAETVLRYSPIIDCR